MATCLGIDTSNYTTSAALFDGSDGQNEGQLLDVPEGALGLRQSDALFLHVKRLPEIMDRLLAGADGKHVMAVGASTRPRRAEGSYMPCFLAGESMGKVLADVLGVPFIPFSHQEGHIAAAAWSAGRIELLDAPLLAWHLSGGTTELLHVVPDRSGVRAVRIGGTTDLSAGQLIDRTGKSLGLPFPAGKAVDALAATYEKDIYFTPKVQGLTFSLSGLENKIQQLRENGETPHNIAYFAIRSVSAAVEKTTLAARKEYPGLPVLFSGGVASSRLLKKQMKQIANTVFGLPEYSADNAMGIAILTERQCRTATVMGPEADCAEDTYA